MIWSFRPAVGASLLACPLIGVAGAAYPLLLLGEARPPGAVAAFALGVAATAALAPIWALPAAIRASAGDDGCSPRVVMFALGRPQLAVRLYEIAAVLRWCLVRCLLGGVGAVAAVLASGAVRGGLSWGPHLGPTFGGMVAALAVAVGAVVVGWLLGVAARSGTVGQMVYIGALAVTVLLAGASYFAPVLGPAASAAPGGLLLTSLREHLLAVQFTERLSGTVAAWGALGWAVALVALAGFRVTRAVR